jgi:hypothetical protein
MSNNGHKRVTVPEYAQFTKSLQLPCLLHHSVLVSMATVAFFLFSGRFVSLQANKHVSWLNKQVKAQKTKIAWSFSSYFRKGINYIKRTQHLYVGMTDKISNILTSLITEKIEISENSWLLSFVLRKLARRVIQIYVCLKVYVVFTVVRARRKEAKLR